MTMDYEIITNPRLRVRIGGVVYPLRVKGGEDVTTWDARQEAALARGAYGEVQAAYYAACHSAGVPCRMGWEGIVNAIGDFARVTMPRAVE